jgi:hypothetical protein
MYVLYPSLYHMPPTAARGPSVPTTDYDGQSHCVLLPKKLQNKRPLLRDMPYGFLYRLFEFAD